MKKRFKDKRSTKRYYYWKRCNVLRKSRWSNVHHYASRFASKKLETKNDPIILKFQEVVRNSVIWGFTPYTSSNFADVRYKAILGNKVITPSKEGNLETDDYFIRTPLYKKTYQSNYSINYDTVRIFLKDDMLDYAFNNIITDMDYNFKTICSDYNVNFDIEDRCDYYKITGTMICYEEQPIKEDL